MADDSDNKTEEPTGRRLDQAREKGQVPYTKELGSTIGLVGVLYSMYLLSDQIRLGMTELFRAVLQNLTPWTFDTVPYWHVLAPSINAIMHVVGLVMLVSFVGPLIGHFSQKGLQPMPDAAEPSLEKMNPLEGLKRLVSAETLTEFAKSFVKAMGLMMIFYFAIKPYLMELAYSAQKPYESALVLYGDVIFNYLLYSIIFMVVIIGSDYWLKRRQHRKRLMMARHEVQDENKDTEGNPQLKGKVREIQRERSRRKIDKEVPSATVIVTNPTHFAIALKYKKGETPVPKVIAKGVDFLAHRIRDIAQKNNVPIIENPPLARAIYRDVKVGHDIPKKFYSAVAKIIATIFKLEEEKKIQKARSTRRRPYYGPNSGMPLQ